VYADLTSPEDIPSAGGAKYILNLIDDLSGMTWTYFIKEKSHAEKAFIEWHVLMENESSQQVKCLWTENGGEFTSAQFENHLFQ